jgi:hypothetical protein
MNHGRERCQVSFQDEMAVFLHRLRRKGPHRYVPPDHAMPTLIFEELTRLGLGMNPLGLALVARPLGQPALRVIVCAIMSRLIPEMLRGSNHPPLTKVAAALSGVYSDRDNPKDNRAAFKLLDGVVTFYMGQDPSPEMAECFAVVRGLLGLVYLLPRGESKHELGPLGLGYGMTVVWSAYRGVFGHQRAQDAQVWVVQELRKIG